ncbi:hypothetical protein [Streptomyces huiliensis]|uniref:hypothetical protein n=1 Tax=Streptomyces huiliensis TaxID=2876027 RepID=UPI001CBF359C|nr:hypothetical protein [Streptomyces huiliensis]MBZ4323781.1 hypothetical protein [Streptomyces huiliensis]
MTHEEGDGAVPCPHCATTDNAPVAEARTDKRGYRVGLPNKLAPAPDHDAVVDGCAHFAEGLVLAGLAGFAADHFADKWGLPRSEVIGGIVAALMVVGLIFFLRSENRDARRVRAGRDRAAELTGDARYCFPCGGVFHPSGTPWQGLVTPDQYRRHVWTGAGYGDLLDGKGQAAPMP